ncbi:hypothetical protein Desdi_1969 [Desulfitobacterium dichloroeliminans LMG P-21439]|uniref:Uncharacterized protein n=1 Tax=Desulfitobacterium dichloroeliminans (strain LMG P-21439 / DCA1) TaxID=871963 RepID=L0F893_DESDL|nr:hypothetical protein [Desulfitobacterium dichloroeliminans]AGA69417.1 hypothetical protein Desdi_1969 [Desulfitobacterium dichloroeliminans LMG P-21439]
MSKPKERDKIVNVIRKKDLNPGDKIPPFDAHDNDKIGKAHSKERT